MSESRKRILDLLADEKISVEEAERLLDALNKVDGHGGSDHGRNRTEGRPKYFYVNVDESGEGGDRVNVKVPLALIRAGVSLTKLIPSNAARGINQALGEKGTEIDIHNLGGEEIDQLIDAPSDFEIEVQSPTDQVYVYVG